MTDQPEYLHDSGDEPVTTIHLVGMPTDVTEREVYLLVGTLPGFEHGILRFHDDPFKGPQGFIKFDTPQNAEDAVLVLNGMPFSQDIAQTSSKIHASMTSSQGRFQKRDKYISSNRPRMGSDYSHTEPPPHHHMHHSAPPHHHHHHQHQHQAPPHHHHHHHHQAPPPHHYGAPPQDPYRYSPYGAAPPPHSGGGGGGGHGRSAGAPPGAGPTCYNQGSFEENPTTIFVVLPPGITATEETIHEVFASYPGLEKVVVKDTKVWARFDTQENATRALAMHMVFHPKIGGTLHVRFARKNMR